MLLLILLDEYCELENKLSHLWKGLHNQLKEVFFIRNYFNLPEVTSVTIKYGISSLFQATIIF